jgi:hypothetical protein
MNRLHQGGTAKRKRQRQEVLALPENVYAKTGLAAVTA